MLSIEADDVEDSRVGELEEEHRETEDSMLLQLSFHAIAGTQFPNYENRMTIGNKNSIICSLTQEVLITLWMIRWLSNLGVFWNPLLN